MTTILKIISFIGLAFTLIPSFLVMKGVIDPQNSKILMLIGTIIWFITASFWMNKTENEEEVE